ncbi:hypothetical protein F2P45_12610 [Massilia sp. CCM 8733]|uniref:Uncharacterized protein n=1 Tax=Massilia mucilaginosa TaxID=2609282 RepID=A0ABX0NSW2_9BURK|nr:hypothetical protein [Massilia mucilaginosa]NHZ89848.1 hypothetical protein [Massilia mucilaginosa]
MPARRHLAPPEGTFIIMQQRGHDRILFEVKAGKMVSIRVEPDPDDTLDADDTDQAVFPHMDTKGNC